MRDGGFGLREYLVRKSQMSHQHVPRPVREQIEQETGFPALTRRRMNLRLLVCGGRDFSDDAAVTRVLDHLHATRGIAEIIEGGARGADSLARVWAERRGVSVLEFPADWKRHGRRAGFVRNGEMLLQQPDGVVAFPGGAGTADMMRQARGASVPVWEPCSVLYREQRRSTIRPAATPAFRG